MTEVLVDYTQFEPLELATQLHEAVQGNEALLQELGVVARYGASLELAEQNVRRGQANTETGITNHYAVVNEAGNVVGAASSYPDLRLRKLHLPIPPALAIPPLAVTFKYANPNIHAWTDVKEEEVLVGAYRQLADMNTSGRPYFEPTNVPWTIEPIRSPKHIRTALNMAGLGYEWDGVSVKQVYRFGEDNDPTTQRRYVAPVHVVIEAAIAKLAEITE